MLIEEWFDEYQYEAVYNIGESGVKAFTIKSLGIDLSNVCLRYGFHKGKPELRKLIAEDYGVDYNRVVVTTGASEAIFTVMASVTRHGDHVVIEHPNYPSLYEVPYGLGCRVEYLRLRYEDGFKPNLGELEDLIKPETKLVALTHPNNPTGSMISKRELEKLIELVERKGVYLLFDETYRELSLNGKLPPAATLSDRVISVSTMSKAYGLPGIRIGWVVASKEIIDSVCAVREQLTICNSIIGEEIALSVLKRKEEILREVLSRVKENIRFLKDWMSKQDDLDWIPPEGGVVCFPRLKINASSMEFCKRLIEEYKTFTVPGECFEFKGHFRIGFGGDSAELRSGLENVGKVINEFKGKES